MTETASDTAMEPVVATSDSVAAVAADSAAAAAAAGGGGGGVRGDSSSGDGVRAGRTAAGRGGGAREEIEIEGVARKMFYGGCALLPWLWLVNIIYFRKLYFAEDCPPGVKKCAYGFAGFART